MKKKLSIQQRLIFPIILLGIVAFISNVLSVFNINNVNFNASKIVDNYMVGLETLQNIRHTTTNIHPDSSSLLSLHARPLSAWEDQLDPKGRSPVPELLSEVISHNFFVSLRSA